MSAIPYRVISSDTTGQIRAVPAGGGPEETINVSSAFLGFACDFKVDEILEVTRMPGYISITRGVSVV